MLNREYSSTTGHYNPLGTKLDFKNGCADSGPAGIGSGGSGAPPSGLSPASPDSQQFNIFPAIFSRQLNFTGSGATCATGGQTGKLMDDLRPNLVGGLLGLQQGLLDDHNLSHGNLQHNAQDSKFMSLQDNRLMGIGSHENRLLGLSQENRVPGGGPAGGQATAADKSLQRKCSSTPEDFSALYGGLTGTTISDHHHHHTPAHTPPNRLSDNASVTGESLALFGSIISDGVCQANCFDVYRRMVISARTRPGLTAVGRQDCFHVNFEGKDMTINASVDALSIYRDVTDNPGVMKWD